MSFAPHRTVGRLAGLATAAGAGALAWASLIERHWYALRHVTVPALRPGAQAPLRVLHLSDVHLLPGMTRRTQFVTDCLATEPDLVVATGDLIEDNTAIPEVLTALAPATAGGRPALFVLGSHDRFHSSLKSPTRYLTDPGHRVHGRPMDTMRLLRGMFDIGWRLVENARLRIDTPAGPVDVAGLGDAHADFDRPGEVDPSPPAADAALHLGVCHAPYRRCLDALGACDLVLAGHTHGGQVRMPGVGALVNNCDLPLPASRGLSADGDRWLHVSAGLGHSRYAPIRFACRPEATLLDLVLPPETPPVSAERPPGAFS